MTIRRVPADYPTVASAVAAAAPGDTIFVAGSVTTDEMVTVSVENLTFSGASPAHTTLKLSGVSTIHLAGTLPFSVIGTDFGNVIFGNSGANTLVGGANIDQIHAGTGDTVQAGNSDDTIYLSGKPVHVDGGQGDDLVRILRSMTIDAGLIENVERFSIASGLTVRFDSFDYGVTVRATSLAGAKTVVTGTAFDDLFYAGAGADRFVGNAGKDTVSYLYATGGVTASLGNPAANTGDAAGDTYGTIENLTGSKFDDILSGNGGANLIDGGFGDDTLIGGRGDTLYGGRGNDVFVVDGTTGTVPDAVWGERPSIFYSYNLYTNTLKVVGETTFKSTFFMAQLNQITVADGVTADFSRVDGAYVRPLYVAASAAGGGATIKAAADPNHVNNYVTMLGGQGADTLIGSRDDYTFFTLSATPALVSGRGHIYVTGDVTFTADNVRGVSEFTANPGYSVDLSNLSYGNVVLTGNGFDGGADSNLTGTMFDDRFYGYSNGGTYTGGKGVDIIIGSFGDPETFVYHPGDTGITKATLDQFAGFDTGKDHVHLDGVVLDEQLYAEVQIYSSSYDDALQRATDLMADGSKNIVYVGGGAQGDDHEYAGWLFWKTDVAMNSPDQAIQYDGGDQISRFAFGDLA